MIKKYPNAVIFGCSGLRLTEEEKSFFSQIQPFGFILFARNIESKSQVKALTSEMRDLLGWNAPILIDQEGGRVQRLREPLWRNRPSMSVFVQLARHDLALARQSLRLNNHIIANDLVDLGIDVNCAPVLDIPSKGSDPIIGDRALGNSPDLVIDLGRAAMDGLLDGGIMPVIKHIPGHGRARVDSHLALPHIQTTIGILKKTDFFPFRALRDAPWAMTAHVVYEAIDNKKPATLSPLIIQKIIRDFIGFDGLLISDDLSMKALQGDFVSRTEGALKAGCDIVLHCNGQMKEMMAVCKGIARMTKISIERSERATSLLRSIPLEKEAQNTLDKTISELTK
jgi:beta-N-acetylhexosaminidase